MNCSEREDLAAFLDGELDEHREQEIRAHIEVCPRCRRAAELLKRSYDALEYLEAAEPPEGFADRVKSRVGRRTLAPLAAAAAVLLTIGLFYAGWNVRRGSIQPENGHLAALAQLSEEERGVIENMDILENYEVLSDLELLAQYEMIEEFEEFPEIESLYDNGRQT